MSRCNDSQAFTLIEVVIATIIIIVALVPLFSLMIAGHQGTAFSVRQSKASNMALEIIEAVEGLPYDEVTRDRVEELARYLRPDVEGLFQPPHIEVEEEGRYAPSVGVIEVAMEGKGEGAATRATLHHILAYKIVRITIRWNRNSGSGTDSASKVCFSTVVSKVRLQ